MPESKKRHLPEQDLVYPQLSSLTPHDIANDLEFLFAHRRNMMGIDAARAGYMGFNPIPGGHPLPFQIGFEPAGIGMGTGIPDGPNRFPHGSFQQSLHPQGQMFQGYAGPGGPGAPRLTHHHSAPPGTLPNLPAQMMIDQEAALGSRSGLPPGVHLSQYPPNMPVNLMRRSISPVLVHSAVSGNGGPLSGAVGKGGGRNLLGTNAQVVKDHKRLDSSHRVSEGESFDQEKDWELHPDRYKAREKETRGREALNDSHFERERVKERERDRDYDRESEQDLDRPSHLPMTMQRGPSHQHPVGHLHPSNSQAAHHHGPHHHHHHHHHVHHHHHPNGSGPGQVSGGASSTVAALHPSSNGIMSRHDSPLPNREFDRRAHSGAPVEVIDLSSKPTGPGPAQLWKTRDELPGSALDAHEQSRRNIGPSIQERPLPPPGYPSSPRSGPGIPPPSHASVARSRRESWGAADEGGQPRPSSSTSSPFPNSAAAGPARIPTAGSTTPRPQVSPSIQTRPSPVMVSPSRQNPIRLPPLSPSLAATARSPLRGPQILPGPGLPAVIASNPSSPKTLRRTSPPPGRPKSPLTKDLHSQILSGPPPPPIPLPQKSAPTSPGIFPAPLSHPSLPPNPRLPIIGASSET